MITDTTDTRQRKRKENVGEERLNREDMKIGVEKTRV